MKHGILLAICISRESNSVKSEVHQALLITDRGIENDAPGSAIRQVSMLDFKHLQEFAHRNGIQPNPGDFGENLVVKDLDLSLAQVGEIITVGTTNLEVVQLGFQPLVQTHSYRGFRLLPQYGIFCRIRSGGPIKLNDPVHFGVPRT